jgi:hypothetical protein
MEMVVKMGIQEEIGLERELKATLQQYKEGMLSDERALEEILSSFDSELRIKFERG